MPLLRFRILLALSLHLLAGVFYEGIYGNQLKFMSFESEQHYLSIIIVKALQSNGKIIFEF